MESFEDNYQNYAVIRNFLKEQQIRQRYIEKVTLQKKIDRQLARQAEIAMASDLYRGNIFTKSIILFTDMPFCGTLLEMSVPAIAVSRR